MSAPFLIRPDTNQVCNRGRNAAHSQLAVPHQCRPTTRPSHSSHCPLSGTGRSRVRGGWAPPCYSSLWEGRRWCRMGWLHRAPGLDSAVSMFCPSYSGVPTGGWAQARSTWGLRKAEPGQAGDGAAQMPRNREFLDCRAEQWPPTCRWAYLDCAAQFLACSPVRRKSATVWWFQKLPEPCRSAAKQGIG